MLLFFKETEVGSSIYSEMAGSVVAGLGCTGSSSTTTSRSEEAHGPRATAYGRSLVRSHRHSRAYWKPEEAALNS